MPVRRLLRRVIKRLRAVWELAKGEHASPRGVGWAVGVGVFAGCTPAVGFHGWLAVGLATVLRLNRLWAFLGSRVSSLVILPWIVLAEVQLAHRVRTGAWAPLHVDTVLHEGRALLVDWVVGMVPVGGLLAVILGVTAYVAARRFHARAAANAEADVAGSADHLQRP